MRTKELFRMCFFLRMLLLAQCECKKFCKFNQNSLISWKHTAGKNDSTCKVQLSWGSDNKLGLFYFRWQIGEGW